MHFILQQEKLMSNHGLQVVGERKGTDVLYHPGFKSAT